MISLTLGQQVFFAHVFLHERCSLKMTELNHLKLTQHRNYFLASVAVFIELTVSNKNLKYYLHYLQRIWGLYQPHITIVNSLTE